MFDIDSAFGCYAFHTSELDRIVEEICNGATSFDTELTLTNADMEYIRKEVERRMN